jgi:hypothetical protein
MASIVEFPLEDGGVVAVEATSIDGPPRPLTRGIGGPPDVTTRASETFQAAIAKVQPAASALIAKMNSLADRPDQVELEFGIKLSAEFGAVIAKGNGEANFTVRMRWTSAPSAERA